MKIKRNSYNMDLKMCRLTKIEERPDAEVPNNKAVGYVNEGLFFKPPEVGYSFVLGYNFLTSIVTEIIDDHTFKTLNSVYRWEILDHKLNENE